jgi:hypothetical protein
MKGMIPRPRAGLPCTMALALLLASSLGAAPWIAITEIHYQPPEGEALEFVEIFSREPPRADLSGWSLEGEVSYRFPEGSAIRPGEHLVVARDPEALRAAYPRLSRALGPFRGKLDNKGGRVLLRNAAGAVVCEARYRRGGKWPAAPAGTGHTLSLKDPGFDPRRPESWAPSPRLGGTPGADNGFREDVRGVPIVRKGDVWRFFRGHSAPPGNWRELAFDDRNWESGPSGFGYGDDDDATELPDMRGSFLSLFTRRTFTVEKPEALGRLILRVDYDDGFIAYLNGVEAARAQMGPVGSPVRHDTPATGKHEAGVPAQIDLGPASRWLRAGSNLIAVQVHNESLDSSDLSLIVELEARTDKLSHHSRGPLINEVFAAASPAPDAPASFIEIFNPDAEAVDLAGWYLSDDPSDLKRFRLPALRLEPAGFRALGEKELGGKLFQGSDLFAAISPPDATRVADAVHVEGGGLGKSSRDGAEEEKTPRAREIPARGCYPDGAGAIGLLDAPTPGAPNPQPKPGDLVINEIMYHPISGEAADEFIEIYNRGGAAVALEGYRLRGGVSYDFQPGESIGAGGYLVVANDPRALASKYGLARAQVVGPFTGALSNRGEELEIRDARGRVINRALYADRDPWPHWADGGGSSLELIHPALDGSLAGSWAASDESAKAQWQAVRYVKEHRAFNGRNLPELQFLLLDHGECLIDDVVLRASSDLVADGFEKGDLGWTALGTHERSGLWREQRPGAGQSRGRGCYRLVADGRGNARHNHVTLTAGGLAPGQRCQLAFRVKWQRGSQYLLTRTAGQGVAQVHRLEVPKRLGTPGRENSTYSKEPPPVIGTPSQQPIAPSTEAFVLLEAPISAASAIQSAEIRYRRSSETEWRTALLSPASGLWRGQIPPLPPGVVEFYLWARDDRGREGTYPARGPERPALYEVGLIPNRSFPTYTLLVSAREWEALAARPRLSNQLASGTLVYGDSRIFYNVGFRRRGSPFTRSRSNWRIVFGAETLDGRGTLTLDGQGGDGTNLNERLSYWLLNELHVPTPRQQYVYFRMPGREEGIYEDVEKLDAAFLARWFEPVASRSAKEPEPASARSSPRAARGKTATPESRLHKVDDYFELFRGGQLYIEAFFKWKSLDPEDYRWNFPLRANGRSDDFQPLLKLIHFLDPQTTPDKPFAEKLEEMLDADSWTRVLAARTLADDWDTIGRERGKNAYVFLSPSDGRWRLLPWDCDLSWQRNPRSPLFSEKFPSIRRLLQLPLYRRLFLGHLEYLARRKLDPEVFEPMLEEMRSRSGAAVGRFRTFASTRRDFVLSQMVSAPFVVSDSARVRQANGPDLLRVSGGAPALVQRFRLDGREGKVRFEGAERWTADFPVGPEGGRAELLALDLGGGVVARSSLEVKARSGAPPLPVEKPPPKAPSIARVSSGGKAEGEAPQKPETEGVGVAPPEPPVAQAPEAAAESPASSILAAAAATLSLPPVSEPTPPTLPEDALLSASGREPVGTSSGGRARPRSVSMESPAATVPSIPERAIEDDAAPLAEREGGGILKPLLLVFGLLGAAQLAFLLVSRRRRRPAGAARGKAAQRSSSRPLADLGGADFARAAAALEALCAAGRGAVPALLEGLEDRRRTPFQKVRRKEDGRLVALPASAPGSIQVRHITLLLLERAIGKPAVARPEKIHWEAHWKRVRGA